MSGDPLREWSERELMAKPWLAAEGMDVWLVSAERTGHKWTDCLMIVSPIEEAHAVPVFFPISPLDDVPVLATDITRATRMEIVQAAR